MSSIDRHTMDLDSEAKVLTEQVLSQKLDQLSPFKTDQNKKESNKNTIEPQATRSSIEINLLKMTGTDFQSIPDYLRQTNQSFEKKFQSMLPPTITLEELRDIAILMHKIMSIEIVKSLWIVYRRSGMGELQSTQQIDQSERKIWPNEVRSLMKQSNIHNINEDEACLTFVNHCLHELNDKSEQYRHELTIKTSRLSGYTRSMEYTIEKFLQQGIQTLHIEIDQQIALVQYHYTDKILKHAYLTQNPNENQRQSMKRLFKLKYNQEITKHEVDLLKEKISSHLVLHPFERESIAKLPFIDSIHDSRYKQQLYNQYKYVAEQAKNHMMTVYMECAEGQKQQYQNQYEIAMEEIRHIQNTLPSNQQLTKAMWNLIQQRLNNICTHIECIYKLKTQLFRLESNVQ